MLVLSRKLGQQVVLGEEISVTVVEIRGGRVKLGFSAPPELPIRRSEIDLLGGSRHHEVVAADRHEQLD